MKRKGHKPVLAFLTLLFGMTSTSFAYDIEVPNKDGITIYYSWTTDNKTSLAVSKVLFDSTKVKSGRLCIPANVSYQERGCPVVSIGSFAISKSYGMKSVDIPNTVLTIGEYAFSNCDELTDVKIPNSVKTIGTCAFEYCHNLTNVTMSNSVNFIGRHAFNGCINLTSITIPESISSIGDCAFYGNNSLTRVEFYCEKIGDWLASTPIKEVIISDKVNTIGECAFFRCGAIKNIIIPESVIRICDRAFDCCRNLANISIPSSVKTIGKGAFGDCENLRKVVIEGCPVIKEDAFYFHGFGSLDTIVLRSQTPPKMYRGKTDPCSSGYPFTEHTFENAVLLIPDSSYDAYAASDTWSRFKHICTPLDIESKSVLENDSIIINITDKEEYEADNERDSIYLNTDEERYESDFEKDSIYYTFQTDGVYAAARNIRERKDYSGDGPLTPRDPQSGGQQPRVPIRTRAQETSNDSLDYITYRGNIVIPESVSVFDTIYTVTGIKYLAFQGCNELESVTIPNSVKQIGYAGFAECTGLTEITIPAGVELIDKYAFAYCSNLERVVIEGNPVIDETAFLGCGTELEVIMAGEKGDEEMDPDDERLDPFPLSEGTTHYGIDGRRIKADTPGLHLIKRRDGTVVKALVR